jgi:hypothetical protein
MKNNEPVAETPVTLLQPLGDADAALCADGVCALPQPEIDGEAGAR